MSLFLLAAIQAALCWGVAHPLKVIDTYGPGTLVYGSAADVQDFAVLSSDPVSALPSRFTICSSVSTPAVTSALSFFQLLSDSGSAVFAVQIWDAEPPLKNIDVWVAGTKYVVANHSLFMVPMQWYWYHACASFDSSSGMVVLVINGQLILDKKLTSAAPPKSLANNLAVGKIWATFWRSLRGLTTNLNVYRGQLSEEAMVEKTSGPGCGLADGDYLSWSQSQWTLEGAAVFTAVSVSQLCQKESDILVFTEKVPDAFVCMNLCPKMQRGRGAPVRTEAEAAKLHKRLEETAFKGEVGGARTEAGAVSTATWLAVKQVGGMWMDWLDGSVVDPLWISGQPSGAAGSDCAIDSAASGGSLSYPCKLPGTAHQSK